MMKVLRFLDPRTWFPGVEIADGMLEEGLEDYLPRTPYRSPRTRTDEIKDE